MKNVNLLFALLLTLSAYIPVHSQCMQVETTLSERMQNTDLLVEGKIIDSHSYFGKNEQMIYTAYTIDVYKTLKGTIDSDKVILITKGGIVGDRKVTLHPNINLRGDETGIFLLKDIEDVVKNEQTTYPQYQHVTIEQSKIIYDLIDLKARNAFEVYSMVNGNHYARFEQIANAKFTTIQDANIDLRPKETTATTRALAISSISPSTVTAGIEQTITITGTDFGTTEGIVQFTDADYGPGFYYAVVPNEIVSWTDTEIVVEVPTRAGTGSIRVEDSSSNAVTSGSTLTVTCAETRVTATANGILDSYEIFLRDLPGADNRYLITMHQDFSNLDFPHARTSLGEAMNNWICETGVNWNIDSLNVQTTAPANSNDGINLIFTGPVYPALAITSTFYGGCSSGGEIIWVVEEFDMEVDNSTNFNYRSSSPSFSQYDWLSVATHELGHAHQLGHVIDASKVMNRSIGNGIMVRTPTADELACADNVMTRSSTVSMCGGYLNASTIACDLALPSTLPVDLLSFSGSNLKSHNVLTWSTASEVNNDYFTIERADHGTHFHSLGKVNSTSKNGASANYTFIDYNPRSGDNFYRLSQTDLDGNKTSFDIINVNTSSSATINLLSTIVDDRILFTQTGNTANISYTVHSLSGEILKSGKLNDQLMIDISELSPSMYIITTSEGSVHKIIKAQ